MTSKHTPGPWHVCGTRMKVERQDTHTVCRYHDKQDEQIAAVWYNPKTHRGFHDAHLIAAAPDMFEALQAFVDIPSPSDLADENSAVGVVVTLTQFRAAVAALAKAKGQADE